MRSTGQVLIVIGVLILVAAFSMDTTVSSSSAYSSGRVHNIGLMDERRNWLLLGGFLVLTGVLLVGFGTLAERPTSVGQPLAGSRCPNCHETLTGSPRFCPDCGTELGRQHATPVTPISFVESEQVEPESVQREEATKKKELERGAALLKWRIKRQELANELQQAFLSTITGIDKGLHRSVGQENEILYRFAQIILYLVLPSATVLIWLLYFA